MKTGNTLNNDLSREPLNMLGLSDALTTCNFNLNISSTSKFET